MSEMISAGTARLAAASATEWDGILYDIAVQQELSTVDSKWVEEQMHLAGVSSDFLSPSLLSKEVNLALGRNNT